MTTVKTKWRASAVDGRAGAVYFQIIHRRKVRRLSSLCRLSPDEWRALQSHLERGEDAAAVPPAAVDTVRCELKRLRDIVAILERRGAGYDVDDVARLYAERLQTPSFAEFMQGIVDNLRQLNRHRTADNYRVALGCFLRFAGDRELLVSDLDSDLMRRYEASLAGRGVSKNTISFYMRILRAVYNRAVDEGLADRCNPFRHVYTGIDKTAKRALPFAAVKRIKELDLPPRSPAAFARDMFLFSFYTRGMSFVDMAYLRKSDLRSGFLSYRRRKTGQRLTIGWERCMQEIVSRYDDRSSPFLLPLLGRPFDDHRRQYKNMLQRVNKSLKTVAALAGLEVPLTMYVARHSWASIARSRNIPVSVISEGMGHNSEVTTRIYLASLDTAVVDRANRLVIKGL